MKRYFRKDILPPSDVLNSSTRTSQSGFCLRSSSESLTFSLDELPDDETYADLSMPIKPSNHQPSSLSKSKGSRLTTLRFGCFSTFPDSGTVSPVNNLIKVLFPAPLGPTFNHQYHIIMVTSENNQKRMSKLTNSDPGTQTDGAADVI
jgi:hypothetical protein